MSCWPLTGSWVSVVVPSGVTEATRRWLSRVTLVTLPDWSVLLVIRPVVAL